MCSPLSSIRETPPFYVSHENPKTLTLSREKGTFLPGGHSLHLCPWDFSVASSLSCTFPPSPSSLALPSRAHLQAKEWTG